MFPFNGLTDYQKWYCQNKLDVPLTAWYGGFHLLNNNGLKSYAFKLTDSQIDSDLKIKSTSETKATYLSLSRYMLKKLAKLTDPKLYDHLQYIETKNPCPEFLAYKDRSVAQSELDSIKWSNSTDKTDLQTQTTAKTAKYLRDQKRKITRKV